MTPQRHLFKRPNSQNWQLRLMVPKAARAALKKSEFTQSLRTTDKRLAADRSHAFLADWKAQIDRALTPNVAEQAVGRTVVDTGLVNDLAVAVGYENASRNARELIADKARLGPEAFDSLASKFEQRHRSALRLFHANDHSAWTERAKRLIADNGLSLPEGSDEFEQLTRSLAAASIDTFAMAKSLMIQGEGAFTPSPFVVDTIEKRAEKAPAGETILVLFERYAAQRLAEGRKRTDTVNQDRKVVELFVSFVGADRSLLSIKPAEVREWRNAMAAIPPGYRRKKENLGLTISEAASKASAAGLNGLNAKTINKYLSTISPLYDWSKKEGYCASNPCDDLFFDVQKLKKNGSGRRPPFSDEQLNIIFGSPLFQGFERDRREWQPGNCMANDWRYWIPLVCLFTGARIGEIAQLFTDDVRKTISGIDYIAISHSTDRDQMTKSGYSRAMPIHPQLKQLGFLEYVKFRLQSLNGNGNARLFPGFEASSRGQMGGRPSRFWRNYLERIGVKDGADGLGSHSFRHGLTDRLRLAGYLDDEIEVALGHNQTSVTAGYGIVRQGTVERVAGMLEKVSIPIGLIAQPSNAPNQD
ncbi:DUF6538 domain-containing protein [Sphingomonas hankookensis]|uniref:site-specific integrase n=1 Tax=Sphingomonas hankookensis TaxID=563996 RepID=UPI001F57AC87|nr:site-specific integrase [Sphingomonas hankookensis]